jgi:hypothetical protein
MIHVVTLFATACIGFCFTRIREENLLQMVLWKTVHFALFLVKISINFSPGYSKFFFITVYVSTLQKFQNFITKISKFLYNVLTNKKIAYSMRVVHSTVGTLVHWLYYIPVKAWSCAISSGVVYGLSGLCSVFQCFSYITHYICTTHQLDCWLGC